MQDEVGQLQSRHADIVSVLDDTGKLRNEHADLQANMLEKTDERHRIERQLTDLRLKLDLYDRQNDLVTYAHYEEPEYLHQR